MSTLAVTTRPEPGSLRALPAVYASVGRSAVQQWVQYRASLIVIMVALTSEPVVYLIVWRTVAEESGGSVDGFTAGRFAAYYIAWGIVRQATLMGSPLGWEHLIRSGELSRWLLRPIHPIHDQLAGTPVWVGLTVLAWLPIGAVMTLVFDPEWHTSPLQLVVFVVALLTAMTIEQLLNAVIGFTAFWLTRIRALDRLVWTVVLLLSGRLVPVELLPGWARAISSVLWLRWTWDFPITTLIGPTDGGELATGLAMQAVWLTIAAVGVRVMWRRGARRYGAVGG